MPRWPRDRAPASLGLNHDGSSAGWAAATMERTPWAPFAEGTEAVSERE